MVRIRSPRRPSGDPIPQEPLSTTGQPIPFSPATTFPFCSLPVSVRWKIYRLLFRTTIPIYPVIASSRLTAHEVIQRTTFPTNLLLVNHQIEAEATEVLWGENQIVLQFPLEWNEVGQQQRWYKRCQTFVPAARHLAQIQDLVIEVYLFRDIFTGTPANIAARPATAVRRELQALCDTLGTNHDLRTCEIRFTNIKTEHSPNEVLNTWPEVKHYSQKPNMNGGCCFNDRRDGFGRTGLTHDELEMLCRQAIDTDEQVLEPLTALRGIRNVTVIGRVTPEWGEYIRRCMCAEPGCSVKRFEPKPAA